MFHENLRRDCIRTGDRALAGDHYLRRKTVAGSGCLSGLVGPASALLSCRSMTAPGWYPDPDRARARNSGSADLVVGRKWLGGYGLRLARLAGRTVCILLTDLQMEGQSLARITLG